MQFVGSVTSFQMLLFVDFPLSHLCLYASAEAKAHWYILQDLLVLL